MSISAPIYPRHNSPVGSLLTERSKSFKTVRIFCSWDIMWKGSSCNMKTDIIMPVLSSVLQADEEDFYDNTIH